MREESEKRRPKRRETNQGTSSYLISELEQAKEKITKGEEGKGGA